MQCAQERRIVVVLLSGGLDSTVAATLKAREQCNLVHLLTLQYGQGAQEAELRQSRAVADWLLAAFPNVVEHFEISLRGSARRRKNRVELGNKEELSLAPSVQDGFVGWRHPAGGWPQSGYPSTRDEAFALIAAAGAEARLRDNEAATGGEVVLATNKDDTQNFLDIEPDTWIEHLNAILSTKLVPRSGRPLKLELPLIRLTKAQVISLGAEVGAPLYLTWSCYFGTDAPCGTCDQCRWRDRAFRTAGLRDSAMSVPDGRLSAPGG